MNGEENFSSTDILFQKASVPQYPYGEQSNPDQTDHNARYQPRFPVDKRKLSRTLR